MCSNGDAIYHIRKEKSWVEFEVELLQTAWGNVLKWTCYLKHLIREVWDYIISASTYET